MEIKQNISISPLLIIGVFLVFTSSCEKEKDDDEDFNPFNGQTTAVFNPGTTYGTMTDQDGNIYKTITIGTQTWMAENLRTTKYNDGTAIPNVTDAGEWRELSTGAYCNYNYTTNIVNIATYGRLYNWYAVNTGKLAPIGWHVPTNAEWTELTDYLGGEVLAGGKLKETGTTHWFSPNTATNETGFTAISGGQCDLNGFFGYIQDYGQWWSATEGITNCAWHRRMSYAGNYVSSYYNYGKKMGFSVRCVMD